MHLHLPKLIYHMQCFVVVAAAAAAAAAAAEAAAVVLYGAGGHGGGGNSLHAADARYNQSKARRLCSTTIIQKFCFNLLSGYRNERRVYVVVSII